MRLFDFFKKKQPSASVAKERLQILVSHERSARGAPSWLPDLKNDILEVIKKYVEVEPDAISFKVGREENRDLLELNIALPGGQAKVNVSKDRTDPAVKEKPSGESGASAGSDAKPGKTSGTGKGAAGGAKGKPRTNRKTGTSSK